MSGLVGTVSPERLIRGTIKKVPSVDETLTKAGACADAKATGDALNERVRKDELLEFIGYTDVSVNTEHSSTEYTYTKCTKRNNLCVFHFACSPYSSIEGGTTIFSGLPAPAHMVHFVAYSGSTQYRMYVAETGEVVLLTDVPSSGADLEGIVTYISEE